MFDFFVYITENGLQHFIPLLLLIVIFVSLSEKVNTQLFSGTAGRKVFFRVNIAFAAVLMIFSAIHILEFFIESQKLFTLPYGDLGVEIAEFILLYSALGVMTWGFWNLRKLPSVHS